MSLHPGDERCDFNDSGCDTAGRSWVGSGSESARARGAEVRLPVELVAGCAFGGPRRCDLYVTTAWYGLRETQRAEQPLAGSLFRIESDTPGVPVGAVPLG